jgi:methyl coenzyme M reductase alpha subunit
MTLKFSLLFNQFYNTTKYLKDISECFIKDYNNYNNNFWFVKGYHFSSRKVIFVTASARIWNKASFAQYQAD